MTHQLPVKPIELIAVHLGVSFDIPEFTAGAGNEPEILLQGDAKILEANVLALPEDPSSKSYTTSRALYANPITIYNSTSGAVASFDTYFTFSVSNVGSYQPADGLVFFLAPWKTEIPTNSGGGLLGVANSGNAFNPFVAVEFDTYRNEWDPKDSTSHVGIDVNSLISLKTVKWDRKNHQKEKVHINYDTKTLTVVVTHPDNTTTTVFQDITLKDVLPEQVSIGFSATTTSGFRENHFIHSWQFSSFY